MAASFEERGITQAQCLSNAASIGVTQNADEKGRLCETLAEDNRHRIFRRFD
jgi:hypothetical protein